MNRELFDEVIYKNWADHFGCSAAMIHQSGTTILPLERYGGEKVIVLWHIGRHTFVQSDPGYTTQLEDLIRQLPTATALQGDNIHLAWGEAAISTLDKGLVFYLYPADLPVYAPAAPFMVRRLTEADGGPMQSLHAASSPEDVDEGFVEVDHQIVFGCFNDDQLVAAASGYERAGFMDIGVLTHPGFRRRGLGQAAVGAICEWSPANGYIAQYRCNERNLGSRGIAEGLNFKQYFKSEAIWLV